VLLCEKLQKPFVEGDLGENEDVLDGLDWDDLFSSSVTSTRVFPSRFSFPEVKT